MTRYCRLSIFDCRLHGIADWHSNRKSKIENRKSVAGVKAQATIEYLVTTASILVVIGWLAVQLGVINVLSPGSFDVKGVTVVTPGISPIFVPRGKIFEYVKNVAYSLGGQAQAMPAGWFK